MIVFNFLWNKKIKLKRSCILKVMTFLIFKDFYWIFLNFYKFILDFLAPTDIMMSLPPPTMIQFRHEFKFIDEQANLF